MSPNLLIGYSAWGVYVHLLANPMLEQPANRGPMGWVRGARIQAWVLGRQMGHILVHAGGRV